MEFWLFMTVITILLPLTMLVFGLYFSKNAPSEINSAFGYRTKSSMKSQDTWEFAHRYCGKLWKIYGAVLLPISVIPMILLKSSSENTVSVVSTALMIIQLVPMLLSIVLTERKLKQDFDENGKRR